MTAFRPSERVRIEGPAGALEALVAEVARPASLHAIVCHPHPLYGGTMDNKVVTTLARALHECNVPTVRFNFRGVGASEGSYDEGRGETEDADAVARWAAQRWPASGLIVAGFSFGAYVALRLAARAKTARLITIAPPVQRFDFSGLATPDCPWLIVQGEADELVDSGAVSAWAAVSSPRPHLVMLPGVGHFFHGSLHELRDAVIAEIRSG
jgi:alpha/beta superfamily hydrolase